MMLLSQNMNHVDGLNTNGSWKHEAQPMSIKVMHAYICICMYTYTHCKYVSTYVCKNHIPSWATIHRKDMYVYTYMRM